VNVQPTAAPLLRTWLSWPLLLLVAVSVSYEALFIHHGIAWLFDEGWPLYAAMRLHEGGVLYRDVLFPFPPGHLLPAWIAYAIDPPGILLARVFYACFNVALCGSIYLLGRRILRPPFALLAALLLAIAAPRSHLAHLLFGYRYLIFSVLTLLAFSQRLRTPAEQTRRAWWWMFAAGAATGVALFFRLTPAFAVSCGVGVAAITASRDWRQWQRDWAAFGLGMALVVAPILAWFAFSVGLDILWREVVTRIVALQGAQRLSSPDLSLAPLSLDRRDVYRWFIALQYRLYIGMYAGYGIVLLVQWVGSLRRGRAFEQPLLLAVSIWGGLYLLRALGRSDDHHLMTALPPACLLVAHALDSASSAIGRRLSAPRRLRQVGVAVLLASVLVGWGYAQRVDQFLLPRYRGEIPLRSTKGEISVTSRRTANRVDRVVGLIQRTTQPQDLVLDLTGAPLFHPLTGRMGPGHHDVVTPGIFLSGEEEQSFVERLATSPPAIVIWPRTSFDKMPERSIRRVAPRVSAWVRENYREEVTIDKYVILVPRGSAGSVGTPGAGLGDAR
jgi:hypothetical protein